MVFLDGDTVVSPGSKDATFDAVGSIIAAIDGVENKEFEAAHCVTRPPGHHAKKEKCKTKIEYRVSGEAFYTKPNKEIYMVKKIVKKVTGNSAKLNCRGGTSDSRFLGSIPRLELGLRNTTIHMVDERSPISDLKKLTKIYYNILENYF